MRGLAENVPWKRFWIPRETAPALDWDGYLVDPESDYGKVANAHARTLEQLEETPCVALLGEPGIGKSRVVDAYRESVRTSSGEVLAVDFRWHHDLDQKLFATRAFTRWREDGSPLTLLLDSLDEHPQRAEKVAQQLVGELHGGPVHALRLRVACRTAEWPPVLDEQLAQLWKKTNEGPSRVAFYALAPLRRVDVELAAGEVAAAFFDEVARVGAEPLAIKPITLAFLLDEYRLNKALPRERVQLYEAGCRRLCEETSLSRAGRRDKRALHIEERLAIASRIAAVCILGRRSLVQVGVVRGTVSPEVVGFDELKGGTEPSQVGNVPVSADAITDVIEVSGLFAPRGAGYVGWAHQTYAEFLAARFLRERGLSPEQMLREVSNLGMGRTVPALGETIAWLASMDRRFFQSLLRVDPAPLLGSDFAMVGLAEREVLVGALLDAINKRELDARVIRYNRQAQARLAHPNLGRQLRPYLVGHDIYIMARLAAVDLATECKVEAVQKDLADVALDPNEDDDLRAAAARAIVRTGSRETKRRLKPLVLGEHGPDPDDELKGYALEALWPEDISAAELFANLTPPKNESHGGSYGSFLHALENCLTPDLLPHALRWTLGIPSRHEQDLSYAFNALLDEILKKGWEHIQDVGVGALFADSVRQRFVLHDGVFGRRNFRGKEDPDLERDNYRRRLLTSALVALPSRGADDAFEYFDRGLVPPRDVPWVVEQLRAEPSSSQRLRWATILNEFYRWGWSFEVADPIIGALCEVEELRQAMPTLPVQVELGSPESRWMRREHRKNMKSRARLARVLRKPAKKKLLPVGRRIRECLDYFKEGDENAGWKIHQWLRFDPEGKAHRSQFEWDLTKFPGWQNAEDEIKESILAVGRAYLLRADEHIDQWLGQNLLHLPAAAGYRYLCLIDKIDPGWLKSHSDCVWKRWAAITLDFPMTGDTEQSRRMVSLAYQAEPARVLDALHALLHKDHDGHGYPFVLSRMAECWNDVLGRFLLQFVQLSDWKPRFLGELLDEMIAHRVDGAVAYAASLMELPAPADGDRRLRMHAAAHALMAYAPELGWSFLWPALQADVAFGREVFSTFPRELEFRRSGGWGKGFSTADAGELCLWLEAQFPKDEDPQYRSAGLHAVTPRDMVGDLRDALLGELVSRGTPEAVTALERIQKSFPSRDFTSEILRAKQEAAQGTWTPKSPREIIELRPLPAPLFMNPMPASSPLLIAAAAAPGTSADASGFVFPPPLLTSYGQNKLAVLFGSGLSKAKDVKGDFPAWDELPARLLEHVEQQCGWSPGRIAGKRTSLTSGPLPLEDMLSELDTLRTPLLNVRKYQAALSAIFRPRTAAPGDVHRALVELEVGVLATTNYDSLLEAAEGAPRRTPYTWKEADKALGDVEEGRNVLFKIHGTADREDTVVMTQAEYEKASKDRSYPHGMSYLLQNYMFLFVGYGINDPLDLDLVFKRNVEAFGSASRGHYALMKDAKPSDCDRWRREFNVQVLPFQNYDDLPAILRQLRAEKP